MPSQIGTPGKDNGASWQERINPRGLDRNVHGQIHSVQSGHFGGTLSWLSIESRDEEHTDGIGATAAIDMMERYANDPRPFFLAVGFYRPHTPYVAPTRYFEKHPKEKVELAAGDRGSVCLGQKERTDAALEKLLQYPDRTLPVHRMEERRGRGRTL